MDFFVPIFSGHAQFHHPPSYPWGLRLVRVLGLLPLNRVFVCLEISEIIPTSPCVDGSNPSGLKFLK